MYIYTHTYYWQVSCLLTHTQLGALVGALKSNRSTDTIDLEGCGIGDEGCVLVRDLLLANKCISDLDLQMNQVTDKGAMTLLSCLV